MSSQHLTSEQTLQLEAELLLKIEPNLKLDPCVSVLEKETLRYYNQQVWKSVKRKRNVEMDDAEQEEQSESFMKQLMSLMCQVDFCFLRIFFCFKKIFL